MGFFDRFKKTKEEQKQVTSQKEGVYTRPLQYGEEEITAFNIERLDTVRHRNNELTDLIMARLVKQDTREVLFMETADYVTFEVPIGTEIDDEIMQAVMKEYERETQINTEKESYYLGRLTSNRDELAFGNKSNAVENIVQRIIQKREQERKAHQEERKQEKAQSELQKRQEFLDKIDARQHIGKLEEERDNRKKSPILKRVMVPAYERGEGKTYSNYDGVNINTGDILKIRQLDKVGKDGSGTYLYSGYLCNTSNIGDGEQLGKRPEGVAVCFELQQRLEDIIKSGDASEIRKVLELLSDKRNFENPNQLTYIGEIDKNGQINRREESTSLAIQKNILKLQRKYAESVREGESQTY